MLPGLKIFLEDNYYKELDQEALKTGTPVRELVVSKGLLTGEQVEQALDPVRMTGR